MGKSKRLISSGVLLVMFVFFFGNLVFSEPAMVLESDIQAKVLKVSLGEDKVIKGILGSVNFDVNLENKTVQNNGVLNLYYNHSSLKDYPNSSIAVLVNEIPVESFFLNQELGQNYKKIIIDKKYLQEKNVIQLVTYHKLTNELCENDKNPALWMTILKETSFEIEYTDKSAKMGFPYNIIGKENQLSFDYIVEDKSPENIESILTLGYVISKYSKKVSDMNDIKIKSLDESDINIEDLDRNFIYIGSPAFQSSILSEERASITKGKVGIFEYTSNENVTGLFILSDDPKLRSKASRIFLRNDFVKEFDNNIILDESELPIISSSYDKAEVISFSSLGYSDFTLKGSNSSNEVFFQVPQGYGLGANSQIVIKSYQHPAFKEAGEITAYINNQPIGSKKILDSFEEESYVFSIPSSFRGLSDFNLKIEFNTPFNNPCEIGSDLDFWSHISKNSYLKGPFDKKEDLFLQDFPRQFISLKQTHFDTVILPNNPSDELLESVAKFVNTIGSAFSTELQDFEVLVGDYKSDGNRLIFLSNDNGLPDDYKNEFSIKVDKDGKFISNEKEDTRFLKLKSTKSAGQVLLKDSNYSMLFLGVNQETLEKSINQFLSTDKAKISGDTFFVDTQGSIKSGYNLRELSIVSLEDSITDNTQDNQDISNFKLVIPITFILIGILVLIVIVLELKKKNR